MQETWDPGSIPGPGRSLGGGHGHPLWYFFLENPVDRGAWWAIVHRVAKCQTQLKRLACMQRDTGEGKMLIFAKNTEQETFPNGIYRPAEDGGSPLFQLLCNPPSPRNSELSFKKSTANIELIKFRDFLIICLQLLNAPNTAEIYFHALNYFPRTSHNVLNQNYFPLKLLTNL